MVSERAKKLARIVHRFTRGRFDIDRLLELADRFERKYGDKKGEDSMPSSFVYRGTNETKKEIYFGVAEEPKERILGGHYAGTTKAVDHWDFKKDVIKWAIMSEHKDQESASKEAHRLENVPVSGYQVIRTAGI